MSDTQPDPSWWQASDGKWYAPELHPDHSTSSSPVQTPVSGAPVPQADLAPSKPNRSGEMYEFCPTCGSETIAGAGYCQACGRLLAEVSGHAGVGVQPNEPMSAGPSDPTPTPIYSQHRRRGRLWIVSAAAVLIALGAVVALAAHHGHHSALASSKTATVVSSNKSTCQRLLPTSTATRLTGAVTMEIVNGTQAVTKVPNPTANCDYFADAVAGIPTGKSFNFILWTRQMNAARTFAEFENNDFNPFDLPSGIPKPVHGLGEQAIWGRWGGQLLVQASATDAFLLSGLSEGASTNEAREITSELTGTQPSSSNANSSTGPPSITNSAPTTPSTTAPPSTAVPTPPSPNSASTPSTPPVALPTNTSTTVAPTTTTAFSATEQTFLNSVQAQVPGITGENGPATSAELISGGQSVCSVAAQTSPSEYEPWATLVAQTTNANLLIPDGPENAGPETFVAIAITDLCPAYSDLIPPGTPGAS